MSFVSQLRTAKESLQPKVVPFRQNTPRQDWAAALPPERQKALAGAILDVIETATDIMNRWGNLDTDHAEFGSVLSGFVTCGLHDANQTFLTGAEKTRTGAGGQAVWQQMAEIIDNPDPKAPDGLQFLIDRVKQAGGYALIEPFIGEGTAIVAGRRAQTQVVFADKVAERDNAAAVAAAATPPPALSAFLKPKTDQVRSGSFSPEEAVKMVAMNLLIDQRGAYWRIEGPGVATRIQQESARALFAGTKVAGPSIQSGASRHKSAFDAWLNHSLRHPVKMIFDPAKPPGVGGLGIETFNTFPGFAIDFEGALADRDRHATKLATVHQWLLDVICNENAEHYAWLLNWCAYLVQRPGVTMGVAPVMYSAAGVGKSLFFEGLVGGLFRHGSKMFISDHRHLTGNFTGHLEGKLFAFSDEALFAGDRAAGNIVKQRMTGETLTIEPKGQTPYEVPNILNLAFASNSDYPLPMDDGLARRLMFLRVGDATPKNLMAARQAFDAIKEGGLAQFWLEMRVRDISKFGPGQFPKNAANDTQARGAGDAMTAFFIAIEADAALRWMENGIQQKKELPCEVTQTQAHQALKHMVGSVGKYTTQAELVERLKTRGFRSYRPSDNATRKALPRAVVFPPLDEFRKLVDPKGKMFLD
jgi:hypothetical protein